MVVNRRVYHHEASALTRVTVGGCGPG
jgi:hypothetical protein